MGQGPGALRALIGALLLACPALAPAEEQVPAADLRFRLEAADGVPGNARVVYVPDREGPFVVEATWTGRGLAGLWSEDASGHTLRRVAGASPLVLDGTVDGKPRPAGEKVVIRFAPMTARGKLVGELRIVPGATVEARGSEPAVLDERATAAAASPVPAPVASPAITGPGACLAPSFAEDAPGRSLRSLAESLGAARPASVEWARQRTAALTEVAGKPDLDKSSRAALDELWTDLDAPPDAPVGAAYRQLLAAVEELVRRELKAPDRAAPVRARRLDVVGRLACLTPAK